MNDAQVARLAERRREIGVSPPAFLTRFTEALARDGAVHAPASARMRLDRVLNPNLRRPVSETTLLAIARALDWTLAELETQLGLREPAGR